MANNWTVEQILDQIQEAIGEPPGSFYNISTRLQLLNQAQREMIQEARADVDTHEFSIVVNTSEYTLPSDFLTYGKEQPWFEDNNGSTHKLTVVDVGWMDMVFPGWRNTTNPSKGTPDYIVMIGENKIHLYPTPNKTGDVHIPYIPDPDELEEFEDTIFNDRQDLNRFAMGLVYKIASSYLLPRAPQLGQLYEERYRDELHRMRRHIRTNPQHYPTVRPTTYKR